MKEMIKIIIITLLLCVNFSCFDDGGSSGPKGTLKITVNTSTSIWEYPKFNGTNYEAYSGDPFYTWQYSEVGGNDTVSGDPELNLSNQLIPYPDSSVGNKKNYVYLYSALADNAKDTPVLYNGSSDTNNQVITITDIEPGEYYVVAFYDYSYGGVQTNILNRYDRYSIYSDTDPLDGTSTPFKDKASTVTISADSTTSVTLTINQHWILGKPKTAVSGGGQGRLFLQSSDPTLTPD